MWRSALVVLATVVLSASALADPPDPFQKEWERLVQEAKKNPALSRSAVESLAPDDPYRVFARIHGRLAGGDALTTAEAKDLRAQLSDAQESFAIMQRYGITERGQRSVRGHYTQNATAAQIVDQMRNLCERWLQRETAKIVIAPSPAAEETPSALRAGVEEDSDMSPTVESTEVADTGDVNPRQGLVTRARKEALTKIPVAKVRFIQGFGTPEGVLRLPRLEDMARGLPFTPAGGEPLVQVERMPTGAGVTMLGLGVLDGYRPEQVEFVAKKGERVDLSHTLWMDPKSQTFFVRTRTPIPKGVGYRLLLSESPAQIPPEFVATPQAKETLAKLLNQNGLRMLFYSISPREDLTAGSWFSGIRERSEYTYDPRFRAGRGKANPLAKYKPTAEYGVAKLQCTTAAGLADAGLEVIVPKDSGLNHWIEGGYRVPPGGVVTEADAHCWNALEQGGALKILDATPGVPGTAGTGPKSALQAGLATLHPAWLLYAVASPEPPVSGLVEWSQHKDPMSSRVPLTHALDQGLSAEVGTVESQLLETSGLLNLGRRIELLPRGPCRGRSAPNELRDRGPGQVARSSGCERRGACSALP